ncbi:MAG: hypothetical protein AB8U66_00320 [Rickettsiales endosymbiont of Dermacentor nuttalli]
MYTTNEHKNVMRLLIKSAHLQRQNMLHAQGDCALASTIYYTNYLYQMLLEPNRKILNEAITI